MPEKPTPRYRAIDSARGLALVVMVLSHSYRLTTGSLSYRVADDATWQAALLLAQSAQALFFLCFGCMLGVIYTRPTRPFELRREGRKLWSRGLMVFLSYKLLVILELTARGGGAQRVLLVLEYRALAAWVEVLDFYSIVLLLAPLLLWSWRRAPRALKWLSVPALAAAFIPLQATPWHGWYRVAQSLLVGQLPFNTFPVLPYLAVVLMGLLLGDNLHRLAARGRWAVAGACLAGSLVPFAVFAVASGGELSPVLEGIRTGQLKHPPRLTYLSWSTATALLVIAVCVAVHGIERKRPGRWNPLEILGRQPLFVFNFHFVAIFGVCGLLLGWIFQLAPREGMIVMLATVLLCVAGAAAWERRDSLLRSLATLTWGQPQPS